jgi:xanthine dehydrogenase YagR molybdenum-binding subunit
MARAARRRTATTKPTKAPTVRRTAAKMKPSADPAWIGIGSAINRVDGEAKVTGAARYAAEHPAPDLLYGVVVSSGIAKGRITKIEEGAARAVRGVVEIVTHQNRPHVAWLDKSYRDDVAPPGSPFRPLYDDRVMFSGQPVALVVAESFEAARYAASLIKVSYDVETHNTDFRLAQQERFMPSKKRDSYQPPKPRGDAAAALKKAPIKIAGTYRLAIEHHNPMEMHATTVVWEGNGKITVYDKTQGAQNVQAYVAHVFGFKIKNVRVLNPYVGGGFGSGLRPQYQVFLACLAAKMCERSVRVVLTRQQMFTHVFRPEAEQTVELGAQPDGKLTAMINTATTSTSRFENNMENLVTWPMINYACENAAGDYAIAPLDTYTSGDMRAPGAATGMTLFEMALDELAYAAKVDPLKLRLINYSETDQLNGAPFTSKALREAYAQGAEAFGWSKRRPEPRSMKDGKELVGWGVATGIWEAMFTAHSASAKLSANGHLELGCATADIGTGTYTVMTMIAAETLGLPLAQITAKLGDSDLPASPVEGGSWAAASAGAAVKLACQSVAKKLLKAAAKVPGKPLGHAAIDDVLFTDGRICLKADPSVGVSFSDVMRAVKLNAIEAEETAKPRKDKKSRNTHSAIFAEVKIDEELGVIRVTRVVNAVAAGRIINPKTARSQILGGVVMGIGMALHEETMTDHQLGRFMNHSFAEYHIPVNADVARIDVIFVDEHDPEVTPLGVKGVGEIGIVGTAAAVANAIYHATGKRVRDLPITIDKLLQAETTAA